MRTPIITWAGAALIAGLSALPAAAELELVMVEEDGCIWCAQWNAEVGDAYAKTPEGRAAPLRRIDIQEPVPEDLDLASTPRLTPTFILVDAGDEVRRIEGYPGEHFFWPLLEQMLTEAGWSGPENSDAEVDR